MESRKNTLDLLHYSDLEQFLKNIKKYNDFKEGKILCKFCNEPITLDNICAILLRKDNFIFLCNKEFCYTNYLKYNVKIGDNDV